MSYFVCGVAAFDKRGLAAGHIIQQIDDLEILEGIPFIAIV